MNIRKSVKGADKALITLAAAVLLAVMAAWWKGGWQLTKEGFAQAGKSGETIWLRLLLGITLSGMVQLLIPRSLVSRWIGPDSGFKGIVIGSYSAILLSGPPYVMVPLIASLYGAGAGVGPIIALLTGESLLGLQNLITWQIPFLGVGIPLSRYAVALVVTPFVGLAGAAVFKLLGRLPDMPVRDKFSSPTKQQGTESKVLTASEEKK